MPSRSDTRRLAAVLFTDIVGSTQVAAELGDARWRTLLDHHLEIVRRELKRFGGRLNDTAGDGVFATFERPTEAIRCAVAMTETVRGLGIEIRAGVHFGETERIGDKLGGIAVHTGARVMAVGGPGEVLVTASTRDLVQGSGFAFDDHGLHALKGIEGEQHLFRVASVDGTPVEPPADPVVARERLAAIEPVERPRGRMLVGGIVGLAVVAGLVTSLWLGGGSGGSSDAGSRTPTPEPTSLVRLDPGAMSVASAEELDLPIVGSLGGRWGATVDHALSNGAGGLWFLTPGALFGIDPSSAEVTSSEPLPTSTLSTLQVVRQRDWHVWLLTGHHLHEVDPSTGSAVASRSLATVAEGIPLVDLAASKGDLWVGGASTIVVVDPVSLRQRAVEVAFAVDEIEYGGDRLFVLDIAAGALLRVDPRTFGVLASTPVSVGSAILRADEDDVWLVDVASATVARYAAEDLRPLSTYAAGDAPTDLSLGFGAAWVGDAGGAVHRIDPTTGETTTIATDAPALSVVTDDAAVWVITGPDPGPVD